MVLVVCDVIERNEHIVKIMEMAVQNKRSLLVFSLDMQKGPLSAMLYNTKKNVLGTCAVNIPYMVGKEEDFLQDIAVITGAQMLKNDGFIDGIDDLKISHFGSATKVIVSQNNTQIIGGGGTQEELEAHKNFIMDQMNREDSKHFHRIMRDRLTRLNNLQAVIGVGGETQARIGENRDLIVDALNSARASLESGILPGGGVSLYHASKLIPVYTEVDMVDENSGIYIFQESLRESVRKIITNAVGEEHVGAIVDKIDSSNDFHVGYNVKTEKIENMVEAGVVDSYKVIKSIIEDSVALANLIIMTECNVIKRKNYTPEPLEEHMKYREFF